MIFIVVRQSLSSWYHRTRFEGTTSMFRLPIWCALATLVCSCSAPTSRHERTASAAEARVPDFPWRYLEEPVVTQPVRALERVSSGVPWPRGLVFAGDDLVVLARGRHRRAGGCDPDIQDHAGSLFRVDPSIAEPVIHGQPASARVSTNGTVFVRPTSPPFQIWDRGVLPIDDSMMNRPFCTLVYDEVSRNYFICGYSGVDLPASRFRKNATDIICRFDQRTGVWSMVESHNPDLVSESELSRVVPNHTYPHHDPATHEAPHGWLNGPNGAEVVGDYLYAVGKDNHTLAQYDLREIRHNPEAGCPPSRLVLGREVMVRHGDEIVAREVMGHSALAASGGYLYLGSRTSSDVIRFPLDDRGDIVTPVVGEVVAQFARWDDHWGDSSNLVDIGFNGKGELFVSCATEGRIWKVGVPNPSRVFDGDDRQKKPSLQIPYVDLQELTDNPKARTGNIAFDSQDRLYICSGNYDADAVIAGVIYRAVPPGQESESTLAMAE